MKMFNVSLLTSLPSSAATTTSHPPATWSSLLATRSCWQRNKTRCAVLNVLLRLPRNFVHG